MSTFAIRRTALIWNSRAIAVFPGGMGTINELFEAWTGAQDHKVLCPIVVIPESFYKPLFDSIDGLAVRERHIISASDFNLVQKSGENIDQIIPLLTLPVRCKDSGSQFTLREKLIYLRHELGRGVTTASNLSRALIIMGSRFSLNESDDEMQFLSALANEIMTKTSIDIRVGVDGLVNDIVTEKASKYSNRIQRMLMTQAIGFVDADAYFESRSAHCESLLWNAKAALFLPSDIPSLNVLFALVCEIQTGRREKMPVFLIGRDFWKPIYDVGHVFIQILHYKSHNIIVVELFS